MIEVEQTRFGGPQHPPEERGNCFAACVASILEVALEDIPAVPADEDGWITLCDWLASKGWWCAEIEKHPWDEGFLPGYIIAGVDSINYAHLMPDKRGGHVIVLHDGVPVWNPSPQDNRGVEELKAALDGHVLLLYPLDPAAIQGQKVA